jgi:GT2 family glycosyltransferase
MRATVVVATFDGLPRLKGLLASLEQQTADHQVVVVDNGSSDGTAAAVQTLFPRVEVICLQENVGFGRAVNLGIRHTSGDIVVLLNNDCSCDSDFVAEITAAIDPREGCVMAAGVLRDASSSDLIDTAGMVLDSTLSVFDYLSGEPVTRLDHEVPDPIGPCAAAAAFDRAAFLEAGGFDENLFAYWEDVDLVLQLRLLGARCTLAKNARGVHAHSATLGSGSARKNYLMGFGRGYVLRKWSALSPSQLPRIVARDAVICLGQAVVDRNIGGITGRVHGYRSVPAAIRRPYPAAIFEGSALPRRSALSDLFLRARRRARLRRRPRHLV